MKTADIPDDVVVKAIKAVRQKKPKAYRLPDSRYYWVMSWELRPAIERRLGVEIPDRLFRSKMRKLIRRGVVDGCACGCRGDYELLEAS